MCKFPRLQDVNGVITPLSCGQCLCCRINKAREWKHRILLEMTQHDFSSFITLTYDNDHLPENGSLVRSDLMNFIKLIRRKSPKKLRYFGVGEYGEETYRPHYHLALFGWNPLFNKPVEKAWNKGFTMTGDLNNDSAAYLVGYQTSKVGKVQDMKLGPKRVPMFTTMSKQEGGLGIGAIKKMADKILEQEHFDIRKINAINYGSKTVPLGRYLTKKMAESLGISEREQLADFWRYQEEVFENYMVNGTKWYEELQKQDESKRKSMEVRSKLFGKERKKL